MQALWLTISNPFHLPPRSEPKSKAKVLEELWSCRLQAAPPKRYLSRFLRLFPLAPDGIQVHLQPTPRNRAAGARLLKTSADLAGKDRKGTDTFPWLCTAACMKTSNRHNDCQLCLKEDATNSWPGKAINGIACSSSQSFFLSPGL